MADLRAYLEKKVREIISTWNEADIYAVSFFVHSNEAYEYKGHSNGPADKILDRELSDQS